MIAYDLQCPNGHTFEGWFEDLKAFQHQKRKNLIACPVCNDISVEIIPSTFGIKTRSSQPPGSRPGEGTDGEHGITAQHFMNFLEKNFEDVGRDFSKEALKMHYDVTEKRNIRGTSTQAEEKLLAKEGIKFFKFPVPRTDS